MMQKAQVFSLEKNSSVRNRLTHSLEVSDVGSSIVRRVCYNMLEKNLITQEDAACMQAIVESACLMHDIGNPPLGHFGEYAIRKWTADRAYKLFEEFCANSSLPVDKVLFDYSIKDFTLFDGNPQGLRIVTRLHAERDEYGLNLTFPTLLSSIKYPYGSADVVGIEKFGYFLSEKDKYEEAREALECTKGKRYFLEYLMELADDVCYCTSDIADAIEKEIVRGSEFIDFVNKNYSSTILHSRIKTLTDVKPFSINVAVPLTKNIIEISSKRYTDNIDSFISGMANGLSKDDEIKATLNCMKEFAQKYIYTSSEARDIEIAGSSVMNGLMDCFSILLKIKRSDFSYYIENDKFKQKSGLDLEWRIYKLLSPRMIKVYKWKTSGMDDSHEWFERYRLIVDYLSGLTDNSALSLYQIFRGISLVS
jgi:dGTPase